jgi:hypothetical protein
MTEYRWGRASLGELPGGVPEKHGWRWRDYEESDGQYQKTLWVARSLPDADGAVRLGCIADGGPAHVGPEGQRVGATADQALGAHRRRERA